MSVTLPRPSEHYSSSWYTEQSRGSLSSAQAVVPLLMATLAPRSVVDVGCGVGTWLRAFQDCGVSRVLGLDGDYVDRNDLRIDRKDFTPTDLSTPLVVESGFDLALCLEVAEHLPAGSGAGLVRGLTEAAPCVLFSAAIPGQGGTNHVNEQWQDHWRAAFAEAGYLPVDLVRPQVWGLPDVEIWYQQNTLLYCAPSVLATRPDLTPVRDEISLNVVHPEIFTRLRDRSAPYFTEAVSELPRLFMSAVRRRLGQPGQR